MRVEFRQLTYFLEVAREQHMTQAAARLRVAQSAISRQIQLLEEELGAPLFVRQGKGIQLSPFGTVFQEHAERIMREVVRARLSATQFHDPTSGTIRLGFPHSLGVQYVPEVLGEFRRVAPAVQFELTQGRVSDLLHSVSVGDMDLAIIAATDEVWMAHGMSGLRLFEEPLAAILPASHSLAEETSISVDALQSDSFILFKPGYTLRDLLNRICLQAGFVPTIALEAEETDTIRGFVRAGIGVSILPQSHQPYQGIREVVIVDVGATRTVSMVWWQTEALPAAARRFIDFAQHAGHV